MLPNTLVVSHGGNPLTLTKTREGNFSSEYAGVVDVTGKRAKLFINHTIPGRGQSGESHLVKFQLEHVDGEGNYLSTTQTHTVFKTLDNIQNNVDIAGTETTLALILDLVGFKDALVNGES